MRGFVSCIGLSAKTAVQAMEMIERSALRLSFETAPSCIHSLDGRWSRAQARTRIDMIAEIDGGGIDHSAEEKG